MLFIWKFFLLTVIFSILSPAYSQKPKANQLEAAQELLRLPVQDAIKKTKTLSAAEAKEIISQIRYLARKRNPDMDRLYFVLRHLEGLHADALAHKRLHNLLWVIALSLFLFSSFLVYIFLQQKQSLRFIKDSMGKSTEKSTEKSMKKKQRGSSRTQDSTRVYRGE